MTPATGRPLRIRTFLTAALAFAASVASAVADAGIQLPQADGATLEIPAPAQRIVTLAPNLTELAFAAGAGDRLVAVAEYSDFPPEARALPRVGDAFRFDLERIMALRPDLVIAWASGNPAPALARLDDLGLKLWRTEISHPEDIASVLEDMARAAGLPVPPAAGHARDQLATLRARYLDRASVRYFYQVSERPLFTLNGRHLVSQGLALCGGANVFADQPVLAPQVSIEAVITANPEVLIAPVLPDQPDPLAHWAQWPRVQAVSRSAMIRLPADEISRATGRTLDALQTACAELDRLRGGPSP